MQIEQHLEIPAPVDVAWDFFTDVPRMVQCIPGAESVAEIDDQHLAVRIKTRVGPISVAFDCHIAIKGLDQSAHSGSANISGRDTKIGAGVKAVTTFALAPQGEHTMLRLATDTDISGNIAHGYGHGIIRQRANAILDGFGTNLKAQLAP